MRTSRAHAIIWIVTTILTLLTSNLVASPANSGHDYIGVRYGYDAHGRITSLTDAAGRTTRVHHTPNAFGGLSGTRLELPGGTQVQYKFNSDGNRSSMEDAEGSSSYSYDRYGRLAQFQRLGLPAITYTYDVRERLASYRIGAAFTVTYDYDYLGRLSKMVTPIGAVRYHYHSATGEKTRTLPNGIVTKWKRNAEGQINMISHESPVHGTLAQFDYKYRLDGLISSIVERGPKGAITQKYRYDMAKRLVLVSSSNGPSFSYSYDAYGNCIRKQEEGHSPQENTYDWAGRIVSHNGSACIHDSAGNLTSFGAQHPRYTFNDINLISAAAAPNGSVMYRYDGDGFLVRRTLNGEEIGFLNDPMVKIWRPYAAIKHFGRISKRA